VVVPPADAVAHPGAVVVEFVHAVIADRAVTGPRGSVDVACAAVFESYRLAVLDYVLVPLRHAIPVLAGCLVEHLVVWDLSLKDPRF